MPKCVNTLGPVAIGGVGGSGTRIFASIAKELGIYMGDTLNRANDNLFFPPIRDLYLEKPCLAFEEIILRAQPLIKEFDNLMQQGLQRSGLRYWGWKGPPTYLHLAAFNKFYGNKLRYVHVVRNGLDMAFSKNQNQVQNWGFLFGVNVEEVELPVASLRYWIAANQQAIADGKQYMPGRFLLLRFDDLCTNPYQIIQCFANFCGITVSSDQIEQAALLLKVPPSIGRYREKNLGVFSSAEIEAVRGLGFKL